MSISAVQKKTSRSLTNRRSERVAASLHDARIPDAVLLDSPSQASLVRLLMPIEFPFMQSPLTGFDQPIIEESDRMDGHGNVAS
jgi:hypothetical protein